MIAVIIFSIISFLIQGIISNYLNYTISNPTIFYTIYVLITLVIMSKYFDDERKYYLIAFIFGLLYDIAYTNTFILNAILFTFICYIAKNIISLLSDTIISINLVSLISIILYHIISFIILIIISYNDYELILLINIITHSIIMTIIHTTIVYYLADYIFNKFEIKIIR